MIKEDKREEVKLYDATLRVDFPQSLGVLVDWIWDVGICYPEPYIRRTFMKTFTVLCPMLSIDNIEIGTAVESFQVQSISDYIHCKISGNINNTSVSNKPSKKIGKKSNSNVQIEEVNVLNVDDDSIIKFRRKMYGLCYMQLPTNRPVEGVVTCNSTEEVLELLALDSYMDVHIWLYKQGYINTNEILVLLSDRDVMMEVNGLKKRKAVDTLVDTQLNDGDKGIGILPPDVACPSVIQLAKQKLDGWKAKLNGISDGPSGRELGNKCPELRAEIMRRILQLMTVLCQKNQDMISMVVDVINTLWEGDSWRTLMMHLLLHCGVKHSKVQRATAKLLYPIFPSYSSTCVQRLIPYQMQLLLSTFVPISNSNDCTTPTAHMKKFITGVYQLFQVIKAELIECIDNMIQLDANMDETQCCLRVYRICHAANVTDMMLNGSNTSMHNKNMVNSSEFFMEYGYRIVHAAALLTEHASVLQVELGGVYVQLAVEFGVPFAHAVTDVTSDYTFIHLLMDTKIEVKCIWLFLDRYLDSIISNAIFGGSNMKLLMNNLPSIVETYYVYVSIQENQNTISDTQNTGLLIISRIVSKLLTDILLFVSGNTLMSPIELDSLTCTIVSCFVSHCKELKYISKEMLLQILELDASTSSLTSRNPMLYKYILGECSIRLDRTNVPFEEMMFYLKLLPYILPGVIRNCPIPLTAVSRMNINNNNQKLLPQQGNSAKVIDFSNLPTLEISNLLEEFIANNFPLKQKELDPNSEQGKRFSIVFRIYLDVLAATGNITIIQTLIPSFRLGSNHRYYAWILGTLKQVITQLDVSRVEGGSHSNYPAIHALYSECVGVILDVSQDIEVKRIFMEQLCIPLLEHCTSDSLIDIFGTTSVQPGGGCIVKQLVDTVQKVVTYTDTLYAQACFYSLLTTIYDKCSLGSIKNQLTKSFCGVGVTATGKELTVAICRAAHKVIRSSNTTADNDVYQLLWSNAYNCLCIVVAKTQLEEQFYDNFLFKEKVPDLFWLHVIDIHNRQYCTFTPGDPKFKMGKLGAVNEDNSAGNFNNSERKKGWARCGGSFSQYFADSLLGTSTLGAGSQVPKTDSQSLYLSEFPSTVDGKLDYNSQSMTTSASQTTKAKDIEYAPVRSVSIQDNISSNVSGLDDCIIEFEYNDVNKQSCMSMMVRVIHRMYILFKDKWREDVIPNWLSICHEKMCDYSLISGHLNIRLFMLRLFLNQPVASIVSKWIPRLLPSILEC